MNSGLNLEDKGHNLPNRKTKKRIKNQLLLKDIEKHFFERTME